MKALVVLVSLVLRHISEINSGNKWSTKKLLIIELFDEKKVLEYINLCIEAHP